MKDQKRDELSIIEIIKCYGIKLPKTFLCEREMREATQSIDDITDNIMQQLEIDEKDWLFDQLTDLQNACFTKMNLELDEYFRQAFIAGFRFSKEIE